MDIAKTPVLLTIGKMEHYEPTEAQRVKADGVIIKPFEATDLVATVQKLIEKSTPVPEYEKTVVMKKAEVEEFEDQSYNDWKQESEPEEPKKATIEMSRADAAAPAFGMDMDEPAAAAASVEQAPARRWFAGISIGRFHLKLLRRRPWRPPPRSKRRSLQWKPPALRR